MAKVCKECAKKDDKVYIKLERRTLSMVIYICPKCKKRVIMNRK